MALVASLSNPTANKIYALGNGLGSVCDFGTSDTTGGKISLNSNGQLQLFKSGAFAQGSATTAAKFADGDPVLITSGSYVLSGVYTGKRLDDDNLILLENAADAIPWVSALTIDFGAGSAPSDGDTVVFTPPSWFGSATTYRYKTVMAAANDLQIAAGAITNMRRLQRAINQTTVPPADYFAGTVGQGILWAQPPTAQGSVGFMTLQSRTPIPRQYNVIFSEYGTVLGTITGGTVTQGAWYKPTLDHIQDLLGSLADVTFRLPSFLGNKGNVRGRSRLIGACAMAGTNVTLTCWNGGYISDSAGAGAVIPRSDYFQGFGNVAAVAISLPTGTYVPFGDQNGVVIGRQGFLFTIGGNTPSVNLYFAD